MMTKSNQYDHTRVHIGTKYKKIKNSVLRLWALLEIIHKHYIGKNTSFLSVNIHLMFHWLLRFWNETLYKYLWKKYIYGIFLLYKFITVFRKLADLFIPNKNNYSSCFSEVFVANTYVPVCPTEVCKQLHLQASFPVLKKEKAAIVSTMSFQRPVSILPITSIFIT